MPTGKVHATILKSETFLSSISDEVNLSFIISLNKEKLEIPTEQATLLSPDFYK